MRTVGMKIRELVLVLLCIAGLTDALFLYVQEERGTAGQFCESFGHLGANCEKVLLSQYAHMAGLPLALWGIFYYLSLVWISVWSRIESERGGGFAARVLLASVSTTGFFVSIFLTYLQYAVIKAWCPFCLISAGITTLIAVFSVWGVFQKHAPPPDPAADGTSAAEPSVERPATVSGLVLLSVLLMTGLVVTLLYRAPPQSVSTLEQMLRFVPRRITPPGGLQYGSDTAPVTVQAFLDYTCPHCRQFETEVFPRIKLAYIDSGRVKWINKLLPHSDEGAPMLFGMSGLCGRFQPDSGLIERALFAYPIPSPKTGFAATAEAFEKIGIRPEVTAAVRQCVDSRPREIQQQVVVEVQQAFSYGLKGPPAFVIDGIAFQGSMDYRTLADLLDLFIKQHDI